MGDMTLTELIERLKVMCRHNTRDQFRELLLAAYDILHLTDFEVAREFGMSTTTAARWRDGITCPVPAMFPSVFKWLALRASEQRFRELVKSAGDPGVSVLAVTGSGSMT